MNMTKCSYIVFLYRQFVRYSIVNHMCYMFSSINIVSPCTSQTVSLKYMNSQRKLSKHCKVHAAYYVT